VTEKLSAAEARALALTAQGFAQPRGRGDKRALAAMIERLGVIQLDSVNVLARSHYLPAWSRLGAYDVAALDRMAYRAPRTLFEYWGHMASLMPIDMFPLFRWRMERAAEHAWAHVRKTGKRRAIVDQVLAIVRERGPIGAGDIEVGKAGKGGWWEWSDAKRAVEWLFYAGHVTTAHRRGFERLYDVTERVLPAALLASSPTEADAHRALIERSARALGVATEADLRDYFRLKPAARTAIAELVEAGTLARADVEGWSKPAYVHTGIRAATIDPTRTAVLSPFDSLVWFRERTERLFGMRYRIEIYTPAHKRVHGYYVLPFLLGDRLVARVDLKADREAKVLRVLASHAEAGVKPAAIAKPLAAELAGLAEWLGLSGVAVDKRGDLAPALLRQRP